MLIRIALLSSLALLCACGSETDSTPVPASTSKPTASKETEHVMPAHPASSTPKSVTLSDSSAAQAPKNTDDESMPLATKPAATPPTSKPTTPPAAVAPTTKPSPPQPLPDADGASGIVHDKPAAVPDKSGAVDDATKSVERAVAHVTAASGSQVSGTITFAKTATGLQVHVVLDGLLPGDHGLHVHEKGDCSAADATSAGDHFNPGHMAHGGRDASERHAGDFGNVTADAAGHVDMTFTDTKVALSGSNSILGRAIVVHADKDDGMTQPAGNSGVRIACGVIEEEQDGAGTVGG